MTRKIGKIKINREIVMDQSSRVAEAFSQLKLLPIYVEATVFPDDLVYVCIGECFSPIKEEDEVPEYKLVVDYDSETKVETASVDRVKK